MKKILIVEDEFAIRKFIHSLLKDRGECDLVVDGLEAVEAFAMAIKDDEPYDLICLDIMMPKVDGLKALKAIRDIEKQYDIDKEDKVDVIIISALDQTEIVEESFSTGSIAYAVKPLDKEKFLKVVDEFLNKK